MGKCKWLADNEICVNDECPMIADYCPVPQTKGICRYEEIMGENKEKILLEDMDYCGSGRCGNECSRYGRKKQSVYCMGDLIRDAAERIRELEEKANDSAG